MYKYCSVKRVQLIHCSVKGGCKLQQKFQEDSVFTVKSIKGFKARSAMFDAGIELIAERGISGFTVSELCKASGLKRTSFYSYFDSIEQYVSELSVRENDTFESEFERIFGIHYQDMPSGVERMVCTLLQFFDLTGSDGTWNKFVMNVFTYHEPTMKRMHDDLLADVEAGVQSNEMPSIANKTDAYSRLVLASMSMSFQGINDSLTSKENGTYCIEMLLNAAGFDSPESYLKNLKSKYRLGT